MRLPRTFVAVLAAACLIACSEPEAPGVTLDESVRALAAGYTVAWNSGDPAQVAAFYTPDGVLTINAGEPAAGRAAVEDVARSFMTAFPDLRIVNDRLEIDGGRINYHWTLTGTNTGPGGTGNAVDISGYESWILGADGLISDSLGFFDAADYQRQLDTQPAELLAMGARVFPADRSLARAEDGVALADGSLLVVDQVHGLRRVQSDGSSEPFGKMPMVGYRHAPPEHPGGANGISLEPGGTHVLVADIFGGGIYRVALADGQSAKLYQHAYGVNAAVRDSTGAIWFTQSAHNPAEVGEARMWAAIDKPLVEGALLRLGVDGERLATRADVVLDGLLFANGIAIDEDSRSLYLAESTAMRVSRYDVDVSTGSVANPQVVVDGVLPDNIELDAMGRLWVGAPLPNTLLVYDPTSGVTRSLLPPPTAERLAMQAEWERRGVAGESRMDLTGPAAWAPFPGFITGVILGAADGSIYLTGLSNALVAMAPR